MTLKNKKIILGFVGLIASGKGTACQYLNQNHGADTFRFSTILRDIADRLYLEQNRQNLQDISLILRQKFGEDLLSKVIANDAKNSQAKITGIDGVRRLSDIKYLKELPNFHLIYIEADQKIRYNRIVNRGENTDDATKTFRQFQKDEQEEAERQIKEVAATAEFTVNNNGTLKDLYRQFDEIIDKIK